MIQGTLFNPTRRIRSGPKYWLTPPDLYKKLNEIYHFDFDPCPYPLDDNFNGLNVEWGLMNFVNPPFCKMDGPGPVAFVKKAIQEQKQGKSSFFLLPVRSYIDILFKAGASYTSLGRVGWIDAETGIKEKNTGPVGGFYLKGK